MFAVSFYMCVCVCQNPVLSMWVGFSHYHKSQLFWCEQKGYVWFWPEAIYETCSKSCRTWPVGTSPGCYSKRWSLAGHMGSVEEFLLGSWIFVWSVQHFSEIFQAFGLGFWLICSSFQHFWGLKQHDNMMFKRVQLRSMTTSVTPRETFGRSWDSLRRPAGT